MTDKQQSTPFPAPPPFYKHFTNANLRQLRKEQAQHNETREDAQEQLNGGVSTLPAELRYLLPPEPPADGKWRSFGYHHDLNAADPTLEEAGIPRLYPDHPAVKLSPQAYLIALSRSLLATFLSTCGVLAQNPGLYEERTKSLKDMVMNMHDLINQYRPHQARESLILMMEEHVDQLKQEIRSIEEAKEKLQKTIDDIQQDSSTAIDDTKMSEHVNTPSRDLKDVRAQQQQSAWIALQDLTKEEEESNVANDSLKQEDTDMDQG